MPTGDPSDGAAPPPGSVPPGTTELGIDIIKVERIRGRARAVRAALLDRAS